MIDDGVLTFSEIFAEIPHDPGAVLVYTLVAIAIFLIVKGSRSKRPQSPPDA